MRIGILSYFNPMFIKEYLFDEDVPNINNFASAVNTLVLSLLQEGHDVKVFTLGGHYGSIRIFEGPHAKVYVIPDALWSSRPDCLKIKGTATLGLMLLYVYKRLAKVVENEIESLDVLHAHWTYEYAMAAHQFSSRIPVFVTVRDWAPYIFSIQELIYYKIQWRIRLNMFRKVMADDRITFIANSQYTFERITQSYPHKNVPIIFNPIKKDYIIDKKKNPSIKNCFISIAQSLTDPRKNITTMLHAFKIYKQEQPDAKLHLVGQYREDHIRYKQWRDEGLLEGIVFHGNMNHSDLMKLMDSMSCLIHPSLEETFGNILLEAMSRCVPCIGGNDSGAVPFVLGNGLYGVVCDIHTSDAILSSMRKISDSIFAESLAVAATQMLHRTYASDVVATRLLEVFQSRMEEKV